MSYRAPFVHPRDTLAVPVAAPRLPEVFDFGDVVVAVKGGALKYDFPPRHQPGDEQRPKLNDLCVLWLRWGLQFPEVLKRELLRIAKRDRGINRRLRRSDQSRVRRDQNGI